MQKSKDKAQMTPILPVVETCPSTNKAVVKG